MLKHHESSWHKAIYSPLGASLTLNLIKFAKISNEFHTRPTPSTSLPRLPFGTLHAPSKLKWINFICKTYQTGAPIRTLCANFTHITWLKRIILIEHTMKIMNKTFACIYSMLYGN